MKLSLRELLLWTAYLAVWLAIGQWLNGDGWQGTLLLVGWVTLGLLFQKLVGARASAIYFAVTVLLVVVLLLLFVRFSHGREVEGFVLLIGCLLVFTCCVWDSLQWVQRLNEWLAGSYRTVSVWQLPLPWILAGTLCGGALIWLISPLSADQPRYVTTEHVIIGAQAGCVLGLAVDVYARRLRRAIASGAGLSRVIDAETLTVLLAEEPGSGVGETTG